ncbi:MAG: cupin domain-containing protein [Anaerolineales bacterium]|nr:MAG: cupin domain-containing protein [Anaerolineales bacterium]
MTGAQVEETDNYLRKSVVCLKPEFSKMYFPIPDQRDKRELFAGVNARTFWGENMLMALVELEPNAIVPSHHHVHEQCGIVLQGELQFTIGDESKLLKPGDVYLIPSGVEHTVIVGPKPAQVLDVFNPVREDFKY